MMKIKDDDLMAVGFKALQKFIEVKYKGELELEIFEGNKDALPGDWSVFTQAIIAPSFKLKGEKGKRYLNSQALFAHQFMEIGESKEYYKNRTFQLVIDWLLKSKINFKNN